MMMNVNFEKINVAENEKGLKMFNTKRFTVEEVKSVYYYKNGANRMEKSLLVTDKNGEYNGLIEWKSPEFFEDESDFADYLENFMPEEDYYIDSIGWYNHGYIYDHEEYKKAVC